MRNFLSDPVFEPIFESVYHIEKVIDELRRKVNPDERRAERMLKLGADVRGGRKVTDFRFDEVYPVSIRTLSAIHWTPVEVAIRAAELLLDGGPGRVLDVGSGCGKFCAVAALSSRGTFVGVERRPHLIAVARQAVSDLQAEQASFIEDNMANLDWSSFDGFYFFNPFYENTERAIRIDDTVPYGHDKFNRHVEIVRTKLMEARPGTRVVTYHGFGGDLPQCYQPLKSEACGSSYLELWVKGR